MKKRCGGERRRLVTIKHGGRVKKKKGGEHVWRNSSALRPILIILHNYLHYFYYLPNYSIVPTSLLLLNRHFLAEIGNKLEGQKGEREREEGRGDEVTEP